MLDHEQVEFYNNIYRQNPYKWSVNTARDEAAFFLLEAALNGKPKSVLDIGCGNGHTLVYLHSKWPEAEYTGVDISDVALEICKVRLPKGEFYQEIPRSSRRKWDVILIMGVAEHFSAPSGYLSAIGERLNQNGFIYLEVPNCIAYSPDKSEGFRKTHEGSDQEEWHWRRETWEKAIDASGLAIVKRYSGHDPEWQYIWILKVK